MHSVPSPSPAAPPRSCRLSSRYHHTSCAQFDEFVDFYNTFIENKHNFEDYYDSNGKTLGKGAFGTVTLSKKLDTGQPVAVKEIMKEGVDLTLIKNEIFIWEKMQHPSLVMLLDVFESEDKLLLVTELMRGGDVFERLDKVEHFSEDDAAGIVRQVIAGVAFLHEHGIVHCDLKPANLLVTEPATDAELGAGMTIKISDFGLSQALSADQTSSEIVGTPSYFAPELVDLYQAAQVGATATAAYNTAVDCWAVGCIIYELIAGHPPFTADTEPVLFYKIVENQVDFPADKFENVSDDAKELILLLTKTDPAERLSASDALTHDWLAPSGEASRRRSQVPLPRQKNYWKKTRYSLAMVSRASRLSRAAAGGSGS